MVNDARSPPSRERLNKGYAIDQPQRFERQSVKGETVGKLVLFLADGTTMDVPLDKERITIGRRADNDVCLPYPAVSGEHAAVVTILADSFLEDLGSTNGTLVNGKAIVKHFLTDHDQIDIGRQRLTYASDNDAKVDPLPADLLRNHLRGFSEKVEPARPLPQVAVPPAGASRFEFGERSTPLFADVEREAAPSAPAPASSAKPPAQAARGPAARTKARDRTVPVSHSRSPSAVSVGGTAPLHGLAPSARLDTVPESNAVVPVPATPPPPTRPVPSVRVLSGASIGRTVPFQGDELSVGRVGVQVAVVRKMGHGYLLIPLEGSSPPRINGAPVAPEGSPLHPGDTFEVAGVRLELSVNS